MEAVLRRSGEDVQPLFNKKTYNDGDLTIDFESRIIVKKGEEVRLTPNEFKLLAALIKYPNKVFTRDELITSAFSNDFEGYDRTIDSHIKNIRQKIETDPRNPIYVKTIHGIGYKFGGE
jgi:DNA-binding response OmpR family regulator